MNPWESLESTILEAITEPCLDSQAKDMVIELEGWQELVSDSIEEMGLFGSQKHEANS